MAKIRTGNTDRVFTFKSFLGVNESADGEADLPLGMAKSMRNFKVTREGNLKIRPGYAKWNKLGNGVVRCLWSGYVHGESVFLGICDGTLWKIEGETATSCGTLNDGPAHIFGFGGNAYILAGGEYYRWDGTAVTIVEGYVPMVSVATPPAGGGTTLEPVNKLNSKRRQRFSPDGEAKEFQLAEKDLLAVLSVEHEGGGTVPEWSADLENGTVTFESAPEKGTDCITITYDTGTADRSAVSGMRYSEIYGGTTDSRVFLYGDGSNRAIYSEIDGNGQPSAEYFPDLNVLTAGAANTPITGMIRHFSRLIVFKLDGAFSVAASTVTLADGTATAAFYITPTQRNVGNDALGQVYLVSNNPRTVSSGAVYEWKSNAGTLSDDERVVKRLSKNIEATMRGWDTQTSICFDDDRGMEWYVVNNGRAIVHNYETDSWYTYTNFPAVCMARHGDDLFFATNDGTVMRLSDEYRSDDGAPINAYWESGAMAFNRDWQQKYSSDVWVVMKPAGKSRVTVTALSNRDNVYAEREISASTGTSFGALDFGNFSFAANRAPKVHRIRIKVKKFTYYSLVFSSNSAEHTATILGAEIKVRYTGDVKQR